MPFRWSGSISPVKYKMGDFVVDSKNSVDKRCLFLFAEVCMVSELEDLSASIDVQDVYTKVKCKIESFSIDHYQSR